MISPSLSTFMSILFGTICILANKINQRPTLSGRFGSAFLSDSPLQAPYSDNTPTILNNPFRDNTPVHHPSKTYTPVDGNPTSPTPVDQLLRRIFTPVKTLSPLYFASETSAFNDQVVPGNQQFTKSMSSSYMFGGFKSLTKPRIDYTVIVTKLNSEEDDEWKKDKYLGITRDGNEEQRPGVYRMKLGFKNELKSNVYYNVL